MNIMSRIWDMIDESGHCFFSFVHNLQNCVTQIYRPLYGDLMFVPFGGI